MTRIDWRRAGRAGTAVLSIGLALACGPALAQAPGPAAGPPPYTVFVDPPTGFVFLRLPGGWKFVGRVEAADLANLPPEVVTRLLPDEPGTGVRLTRSTVKPRVDGSP